jgi:uncharacterized membrane protein YdjX (TVP38/TMEM64 family)
MKSNIKLLIGFIYAISFSILIYYIFSKFNLEELTNLNLIRDNQEVVNNLKDNNIIILIIIFFIFSIIWILLLGFASPLALVSGFIFGKWLGTIISILSFSIGCTLLYAMASLFFKDFIKKKLSNKIEKFVFLFQKNEFLYFMIFRFTGGGMPFAIQNVLPIIFNMRIINYFFATLFGIIPGIFIFNSLGAGFDKFIGKNNSIIWSELFYDPGIYLPISGFLIILIITFFLKNKLFKK